jgi:hypothetical protein
MSSIDLTSVLTLKSITRPRRLLVHDVTENFNRQSHTTLPATSRGEESFEDHPHRPNLPVVGRPCPLSGIPAIPAPGCIPFGVLVVVAAVDAGGLAGSDGCNFSLPFPLSTGEGIGLVIFTVFAVDSDSAAEAEPPPCTSLIMSSTPFSKSISVSSPLSLSSYGPGDPESSLDPGADVCNGEFCIEAILASSAAIWALALRVYDRHEEKHKISLRKLSLPNKPRAVRATEMKTHDWGLPCFFNKLSVVVRFVSFFRYGLD